MPSDLRVRDAVRDLAFGSCCGGCGAPGRLLCPPCEATLPHGGRPAWPVPAPRGLALPYAGGDYDGLLKVLVNRHKEHGAYALARPLGRVLGDVVADLVRQLEQVQPGTAAPGRVVLVPVPSRPSVVRRRGHDPMLRVAREAARRLRRRGLRAGVSRLLAVSAPVRDQAGLTATDRAANLAGSLRARPAARAPDGLVVVVDDVLTTGATAREAQRALVEAGIAVAGIATVAATRRRLPLRKGWFPTVPQR